MTLNSSKISVQKLEVIGFKFGRYRESYEEISDISDLSIGSLQQW